MPTFIIFLKWTDQGAKIAKSINERHEGAKKLAAKLGGKLLSDYVTTGQYDVVATLEMPDTEAIVKFVSAVQAGGNARTTTVRAFTVEEFSKLAAEAPPL